MLTKQLYKTLCLYKQKTRKYLQTIKDKLYFKHLVKTTTFDKLYSASLEKIHPILPETVATPEIREMSLLPGYEAADEIVYKTPEIYTTILNNVIFHPDTGAIFTPDKYIILDSLSNIRKTKISYLIQLQNIINNAKNIEKITGYCALYRTYGAYAHQLIESMGRLFLLDQPEYSGLDQIKLLYPKPLGNLENFFFSRMTAQNITLMPVEADSLYYIENLIFPSFITKDGEMYLPKPYIAKIQEDILPKRPRRKNKRIFLSREKQKDNKGRHVINEAELLDKLKERRFQKYVLENMSIVEQIDLFYDAEVVIAAEGSGPYNVIFSEKINILILSPSISICPNCYFLSKSPGLQHNIHYWHGDKDGFNTNFTVDVDQIIDILDKDFKIQ